MSQTVVRYRVKPGRAAENEELVRAVYAELERARPAGFSYATYKLEDGVTFVHVARSDGGGRPLTSLDAFRAFQAGLSDRCDEQPQASAAEEIGSYRVSST